MRLSKKERFRRIRDAEIEAYQASYNLEQDPGLRDRYSQLPRAPISLVCCQLVKDVNQGGILRLAEAFRLEDVVFSPEADEATDFAGARGTRVWQPHRWQPAEDAIPELKDKGYQVIAVTISDRAIPLQHLEWSFPTAIVMGEERFGIPSYIEEMCDASVAIPLYGLITSLNVTTAAAIVLNSAMTTYVERNPEFEPAREASRQLFLPTGDLPAR